jgi:hypothetical protein
VGCFGAVGFGSLGLEGAAPLIRARPLCLITEQLYFKILRWTGSVLEFLICLAKKL